MWVNELPDLKVTDLQREDKKSFLDHWGSFYQDGMQFKTKMLNDALEVERTEFPCRNSYERLREKSCYRNGYRTRYVILLWR
jgi:hypothetical protein